MKIIFIIVFILVANLFLSMNENFRANCKFPRPCPTRMPKTYNYDLRGAPVYPNMRKTYISGMFYRLFPFFYLSPHSPYQVYPTKIIS
jgi:hypothetical protein